MIKRTLRLIAGIMLIPAGAIALLTFIPAWWFAGFNTIDTWWDLYDYVFEEVENK